MSVNLSPPMRGLMWKETRQLLPLVWMLLGVSAFLSLIATVMPNRGPSGEFFGALVSFVLPAFMAAGAGAILVGQEKETGTLRWTSSLPITAKDVYWSKLIVSLVGLAVMWAGCLIVFSILGLDQRTGFFQTVLNEPLWLSLLFWVVHTVYVLVCGHYTAWRCDNPLTSLLLMLPIAAIPYVLAVIVQIVRITVLGGYRTDAATMNTALALTVPALSVIGWMSYSAMRWKLEPAAAPVLGTEATALTMDAWRPPSESMPVATPFRMPIVALLWQSTKQNPLIVIVLSLMVCVGLVALPLAGSEWLMARASWFLVGAVVVGFLGVSWLGVLVFAGDGAHNRMKFLADRGVSPTTIWLGRHWIGLAVCGTGLLLFALTQFQIFHSEWWQWIRGWRMDSQSLLTIALLVFCVYATSQWVSQTLRIIAGTAFLAPLLSALMIGWLVTLPEMWGANGKIIGMCLAVPFLATWLAMKDHVDGRRGWRFWMVHIAGVFLIFALPIGHAVSLLNNLPGLSDERRAELMSLATQYPEPRWPRTMMLIERETPESLVPFYSRGNTVVSGEKALGLLTTNGDRPEDWLQENLTDTSPLTFSGNEPRLIASTEFYVQSCWLAAESAGGSSAEAVELMGSWISACTTTARRLRASYRLRDQDVADSLEIYLTRTMSHPSMRPWLTEPFSQEAISLVSKFDARLEARRRAVLLSWKEAQSVDEDLRQRNSVGGYDYDGTWVPSTTPTILVPTARWLYRDAVTDQLMQMIEAGAAGRPTLAIRKELHLLLLGDAMPFEDGPYVDRLQADVDPTVTVRTVTAYPAQHWFAPWEEFARQLPAITKETNDE